MTDGLKLPRRAGILLLTAVGLIASLAFLAQRVAGPSDGGVVSFYADAWRTEGVRVSASGPVPDGGLVDGDIVTAVAGRPLSLWLDGALDPRLDRSALNRSAVPYAVIRSGSREQVEVVARPSDVGGTLLEFWSAVLFTIVLQVVAGYVLLRRPDASAAAALAIAAVGVTGSTLPWMLGLEVGDIARGWPFALYALTAGGLYMLLWPAGALHLPLALAGGSASPSRRTLGLAYGLPLGGYALGLIATRVAAPSATAWLGGWPIAQGIVIVPTIVVGLGLSIRGFRRATPATRDQLRWAAVGSGISALATLLLLVGPQLVTGHPILPWSSVGLIALPLPLGIAAGILRYGLLDIEVVVNRALVYGGVTIVIVAIYALAIAMLSTFFGSLAGFSASLLATGLAAVVALPIRDRLQRAVNRLMYGDRDDPYRAITRLGRRLEGTLDPFEAPEVIVRTIAESLRVPWVAMHVAVAGGDGRTFAHGDRPGGDMTAVPLVYGAEVVGELQVATRSPGETLSVADRALVEALARQAGPAVHALGLTLDLVESRERLVAAREEERRRIRRDLHDGLGPTLAAIGMRTEVAADMIERDPAGAARMLADLRAEVGGALTDIRRLVDALRPPALDELGLVGALQAQAGRLGSQPAVDVTSAGSLADLPAAIEVAAYRIAVEAMTNAVRHASARSCSVRVATSGSHAGSPGTPGRPGVLEVEIVDDGVGLPDDVRPGIGLVSMRERAAEVGGTFAVEARAGRGTRVVARLPLGIATAGGA